MFALLRPSSLRRRRGGTLDCLSPSSHSTKKVLLPATGNRIWQLTEGPYRTKLFHHAARKSSPACIATMACTASANEENVRQLG
jgi:hypothetical protein